jgi:Uma2 family endonuclease
MAAEPNQLSVQEYLRLERLAETKSEYLDGQMLAMTGASRRHNLIVANLMRDLGNQLKHRPCELFPSDMRVRIPSANVYTYPDVSAVCGEPLFEDGEADTLLNPTFVLEVLSPSTEAYSRGRKFRWYQGLDSLSELVLVSQDQPVMEQYVRQGESWLFRAAEGLESVLTLPSIQAELALVDVYHKVAFG